MEVEGAEGVTATVVARVRRAQELGAIAVEVVEESHGRKKAFPPEDLQGQQLALT